MTFPTCRRAGVACAIVLGACGDDSTTGTRVNPGSAAFQLVSSSGLAGALPVTYTCDGEGRSPSLSWAGAPAGTVQFAILMSTAPSQGVAKYNWVLYGIPMTTTTIPEGAHVGTLGAADDGAGTSYAPPCSLGPGLKQYTFTIYALSSAPNLAGVAPSQVTGTVLLSAMSGITSASAQLSLGVTRTTAMINCGHIRSSIASYRTTNGLEVSCDSTFAYFAGSGIQSRHPMMNGIRATNQQVPIPQPFTGANAWRIPLNPTVAATKTSAVDGPIGLAINGVPIFNPCKQGGCSGPGGGDTKVLGELDLCNGHAGRADDYHYHAAPTCLMSDQGPAFWDTHPIGWALDGFAIFGYGNADGTTATRDGGCGGNTSVHPNAPAGYAYHLTDVSPYVLSCFHGVPSPDLAGQASKFSPIRPPGTPMPAANMTLVATASSLAVGGTSVMRWEGGSRTYQIRYTRTSPLCWTFEFLTDGATTGSSNYCRSR